MNLRTTLRIQPREVVSLVGAGGKTSIMFRLAHELAAVRLKVITTTTTKIGPPTAEQTNCFIVDNDRASLLAKVERALLTERHVTVATQPYETNKFHGVPADWVADLRALSDVHAVIIEADGARRLPFKAPRAGEPIVPESTTLLVAVAGMSAVGAPLDEEHVCRAHEVSVLTGLGIGQPVRPETIATVLASPAGGLKQRPENARTVAVLNQADNPARLGYAHAAAALLEQTSVFDELAIAATEERDPIIERWGRTTAIIMAAGEGRRFGGGVKQLAPWGHSTLIEHIVDIVERSRVDEVQVILGAHADAIEPHLRTLSPRTSITRNDHWQSGMSTSLLTGLKHTKVHPNAAIFINVDQPGIQPDLIDRLIERHRRTGAPIVAPRYQNMRGNPVLWDRTMFDELLTLSGDVGGREILRQHWRDIIWVELDSEEELTDTDTPEEYQRLKEILRA